MKLFAALVILGSAAPAFADVETPGFVTTDRMDASSRAGAELSYLFPAQNNSSGTAWRFDIHGQYVDPGTGFGGYLSLPLTLVTGDNDSATSIGDAEIGAIYAAKIPSPYFSLIARVGITLPTGSTGDKTLDNIIVFETSGLTNTYQALPKGTSLRLSVSPIVRSGIFFGRADVGIDKNLSQDNAAAEDAFLRLNLAAGLDFGTAAVMAEFVNLHTFGDAGDQSSWISQFALATRIKAPGVQPYAALVFPLDHETSSIVNVALTIGAEVAIR